MYIRLKTIKKQRYAYLSKAIWNKKKKVSRQKTIKYLGRVYPLIKIYNIEPTLEQFESKSYQEIIKDLIIIELKKHNFKQKENTLSLNEFLVDITSLTVKHKEKPVTLQLNEGFLNNYTLNSLVNFKPETVIKLKTGKFLAKLLVSSGLKIKPEHFPLLFQKLYKTEE